MVPLTKIRQGNGRARVHVCLGEGQVTKSQGWNEWLEKPVSSFWSILQLKIYWGIGEVIARLNLATAHPGPAFLS